MAGQQNPRFQTGPQTPRDPAVGGVPFTASADVTLAVWGRALYISTAGNLLVKMHDGSVVTFSNLVAGQVYQFAIQSITGAGSTAAGIVLI